MLGVTRRAMLRGIGGLALGAAGSSLISVDQALAHMTGGAARSLSFRSLHTEERLKATYWADGRYLPTALADLNHLMRDWRSDEMTKMDPELFDLLYLLRRSLDSSAPFEIISAYRSPNTNARLASKSNGVAKKSLHMRGKAIDVHLPGRSLAAQRDAAIGLARGGVGYYPKSGFIHIDTGRVRRWG